MGYLGATLTQVFMCMGGADVSLRCYNSLRWETGLESAGDVTHRMRAEDFGNFEKVS